MPAYIKPSNNENRFILFLRKWGGEVREEKRNKREKEREKSGGKGEREAKRLRQSHRVH